MRWLDVDCSSSDPDAFAPITRLDAHAGHGLADDGVVAERRDHQRVMRGLQPGQRRKVEMVVVVVAEQHDVDARQVGELDARRVDALAARRS